mgnify:CR=1 FL=1
MTSPFSVPPIIGDENVLQFYKFAGQLFPSLPVSMKRMPASISL